MTPQSKMLMNWGWFRALGKKKHMKFTKKYMAAIQGILCSMILNLWTCSKSGCASKMIQVEMSNLGPIVSQLSPSSSPSSSIINHQRSHVVSSPEHVGKDMTMDDIDTLIYRTHNIFPYKGNQSKPHPTQYFRCCHIPIWGVPEMGVALNHPFSSDFPV